MKKTVLLLGIMGMSFLAMGKEDYQCKGSSLQVCDIENFKCHFIENHPLCLESEYFKNAFEDFYECETVGGKEVTIRIEILRIYRIYLNFQGKNYFATTPQNNWKFLNMGGVTLIKNSTKGEFVGVSVPDPDGRAPFYYPLSCDQLY